MAPTSSPPNIAPKQTGYWLVLAVSTVLFACGGDATETAPVPDIQLDEDTTSAPENAAGIPGATTSLLPSPAQWLIADAKDRVWTLLEDGRLGRLSGTSFEEVTQLQAATEVLDVVHPSPSLSSQGSVVVVEAVFDHLLCQDSGSIRWLDPATGNITTRELQEAPSYGYSVTTQEIVLTPIIEYSWNHYNEPTVCLPAQPVTQKLAAVDPEKGILWTLPLERPCGAPTLDPDGQTGYVSDRHRTLIAFDYSSFGVEIWRSSVGQEGGAQLSNPAIAADGTLYVTVDRAIAAIRPSDGTVLWEHDTPSADALSGEPVIAKGGNILVAGTLPTDVQGKRYWALFLVDPSGELLETQQMPDAHLHPATFQQYELTALASGDRITLTTNKQLILWRQSGGPSAFEDFRVAPPLVLSDGTFLAAYGDMQLLQGTLSSAGLADTTWPRWHGSNRSDGRSP